MGFFNRQPKEKAETVDFDEAAHDLFAKLNLSAGEIDRRSVYNPLDAVWKHPTSGAKIFVGNAQAAQSADILRTSGVSRIVNCTDSMPQFLEDHAEFKYLRFDISNWARKVDATNGSVRQFTSPLLSFVTEGLENGESVMVHCLAGAHRAGTTGCCLLMHFARLNAADAIKAAKRCRPVIDPIGMLPDFLRRFEKMQLSNEKKMSRSGSLNKMSRSSSSGAFPN